MQNDDPEKHARLRIAETKKRQADFEQICPPLFRLAPPDSEPYENGPTSTDHPEFPHALYSKVSSWPARFRRGSSDREASESLVSAVWQRPG